MVEKTLKYGPLRLELKQQDQGYEVRQYNIFMVVLGGWSWDLDVTMPELVGSRSKKVLQILFINCIIDFINIYYFYFFPLNSQRTAHTRPVILFYL